MCIRDRWYQRRVHGKYKRLDNMKFVYVIAFITMALALGPGMKSAVKLSTINQVKDQIVPIIMKQMKDIHAKDIKGHFGSIYYKIHGIHAYLKSLQPSHVHIGLNKGTNQITLKATSVDAGGKCKIDTKFGFITDSFHAEAKVHHVSVSTTISIQHESSGRPKCSVKKFDIGINENNVSIHFSGGKISELLNFLVKLLKPLFMGMVKNMINGNAPGIMTGVLNKFLHTLPMSVDITPNLAIAHADYFCVALSAYMYYKKNHKPPPFSPMQLPNYNATNHKGIHFFLSDYTLRSGINAAFEAKILSISYKMSVMGWDTNFTCNFSNSPELHFDNKINLTGQAYCDVEAKHSLNSEKQKFGVLANTVIYIKEEIKNQTIFFNIDELALKKMKLINPFNLDLKWFENSINFVLRKSAEAINNFFGKHGLTLPTLEGISYEDIEEYVQPGYIEVLVTPKIHLKANLLQ
eukprot:TRINITY_DN5279_c0_g1_i2.p1 TRINITY_DN5279_c0_g1~~TRINITY_DN5279_c0_g1_i2.p1  ORF type:complete len:499 (+),score=55.74 TRINITY_DN5279_c0_g1_i2:106-1497(+)